MQNIIEIINEKIKAVNDQKDSLTFHVYLRKIREAYGISRVRVCKELRIGYMQFLFIETGRYKTMRVMFMKRLSEYYGIDYEFLEKKAREYADSQRKKNAKLVY